MQRFDFLILFKTFYKNYKKFNLWLKYMNLFATCHNKKRHTNKASLKSDFRNLNMTFCPLQIPFSCLLLWLCKGYRLDPACNVYNMYLILTIELRVCVKGHHQNNTQTPRILPSRDRYPGSEKTGSATTEFNFMAYFTVVIKTY